MVRAARLKQIEQFIIEREFVTIDELCQKFDIHPNTARSDIKELVDKGVAQKRYGGVSCASSVLPMSFDEKQQKNMPSKRKIGQLATKLLDEDDVIFVDAGTTTLMLFQNAITLPRHLTIITNNLDVINWTYQSTDYTVFSLPGKLNRQLNAFASLETIESLKAYKIHKAFIGTSGVSPKGELTSTSNIDAKLKRTAIDISDAVILMADSQKINHSGMFNFASLDMVDCWVCDKSTNDIVALSQKHNTRLIEYDEILSNQL